MTRVTTHPGRVLRAELEARGMSANRLGLAIRVPANRIAAILRGRRAVTVETAMRLGRFLVTCPAFWMNLQSAYDVSVVESVKGRLIEEQVPAAHFASARTMGDGCNFLLGEFIVVQGFKRV